MTTRVLGIDPGKAHLGWAVVVDGQPHAWGSTKKVGWDKAGALVPCVEVDLVVCERMVSYPGSRVDPNDLLWCERMSGEFMGRYPKAVWLHPTPTEWKGRTSKEMHHKRLKAKYPVLLSEKNIDALDAVGLALWGALRIRTP